MPETIHYAYAVVPAAFAAGEPPCGLDQRPVGLEREGELAALVSTLDAASYAPERLEELSGDVAWLGPRARAHDEVVSWASARDAAVPLPMLTLFRDATGVRRMLRERADELARALARVAGADEYGVRLFRLDQLLTARLGEVSPRVAELEARARAAPPGQRYLLERKSEGERRSELARVSAAAADAMYDALRPLARAADRSPVPQRGEAAPGTSGTAVLDAHFLVERGALDAFRERLTAEVARLEPTGFRVEFTGPWPPYHFAGEASPRGA